MTQPASITGKQNALTAFNTWLQTNVPAADGFTYFFDQALDPTVYPSVEVSEFKFFDPGESALGGQIFEAGPDGSTQGSLMRVVMELNIRTNGATDTSYVAHARQMRDWIIYALRNAGVWSDDQNKVLFPPILILDSSSNATGICLRPMTEVDNWAIENFYAPEPPDTLIARYQLMIRLEWYEMR